MKTPKNNASPPMTPRSCALGCAVWLVVMLIPGALFYLAVQGEVTWRRGPSNLIEDRVFMVNEPTAGGLGYLSTRLAGDESRTSGPVCARTQVTYLLWRNDEGGDQNVSYCQCYARRPDGQYTLDGDCP